MKIKYSIDWKVSLLIIGGLSLIFVTAIVSNPSYPQLWKFVVVFGVIFVFSILNYTVGTYGILDREKGILSRTDYLFYRKQISVSDIKSIHYNPTWIVGSFARSLYIIDSNEKVIEFPNIGWYEPVLAKIVRDLQQLNPSIQLDQHVETLIKKYEHRS